jgi:hypothetical protein
MAFADLHEGVLEEFASRAAGNSYFAERLMEKRLCAMLEAQRGYWRDSYYRHREKRIQDHSERRRQKMAADPAYAAKVREAAKEAARQRRAREKQNRVGTTA